jgi:hypothetical protein
VSVRFAPIEHREIRLRTSECDLLRAESATEHGSEPFVPETIHMRVRQTLVEPQHECVGQLACVQNGSSACGATHDLDAVGAGTILVDVAIGMSSADRDAPRLPTVEPHERSLLARIGNERFCCGDVPSHVLGTGECTVDRNDGSAESLGERFAKCFDARFHERQIRQSSLTTKRNCPRPLSDPAGER